MQFVYYCRGEKEEGSCDSGSEEWILDFSTLFDDLDCLTVEGTTRFSGAKNSSGHKPEEIHVQAADN